MDPHPSAFSLLLVDDDPADVLLAQMALDELNAPVKVEVSHNGVLALARLQSDPKPDLVLMDMNMPILTGLEVLLRLRHTLQGARVVLWSSGWKAQDEPAVMAAGAEAYLRKPALYSELLTLLKSLTQGTK
ncbi:response regulator [Deinococcus hopiensis]|uniref:response regulator n=1 Tax=Deinococcus hopiensis TaxID=309885 RepID=UPI001481F2A2|nr:response regulator [Deinococcus hopiensis]